MHDDYRAPLAAGTFLGGYAKTFGRVSLAEVTGMELLHVAVPQGGQGELSARIEAATGLAWPPPGKFSVPEDGGPGMMLWLAEDQCMIASAADEGGSPARLAEAIGGAGYCTGQTDNWIVLRLAGDGAVAALERICPLDLDESVSPAGSAARTSMEHLPVIMLRESAAGFILLSASSSAASFLHAVETSVRNTAP